MATKAKPNRRRKTEKQTSQARGRSRARVRLVSRADVAAALSQYYSVKFGGVVRAYFDDTRGAYYIGGDGLPAAPELRAMYPKGWNLSDYVKPAKARELVKLAAREDRPTGNVITYRVKFVHDEDARFEECNGESRPLTEDEYAKNAYMGCPKHPRGLNGDKSQDSTAKNQPGRGVCACGTLYEQIPYDEYLRYYGNPDRHVYLGCIAEAREVCKCCNAARTVREASVWGIDFMDDSREYAAIIPGDWMPADEIEKLPGYARDVAREQLAEVRD